MKNSHFFPALILALTLALPLAGQNINTVAGNSGGNYTGDKGPAKNAELHWPMGMCQDRKGNLYIADYENNVIRKVNTNGVITTFAGTGFEAGTGEGNFTGDGGAATLAHLWAPAGICVDTNGYLYIADQANERVRVVDTNGIISTLAGTGIAGFSGDAGAPAAAQFNQPVKVALDKYMNLYIVDMMNNCVRQISATTGNITTVAGNATLPYGYTGDEGDATAAQLNMPTDVAVDTNGNLYIADLANNVVRYVDMTAGLIATVAGCGSAGFRGDGGIATAAEFFSPAGVAIDTSFNLYVSDRDNNRIRKVSLSTQIITTVAGTGVQGYTGNGGLAVFSELNEPEGLFADAKGGIYIADKGNNVIRYLGDAASAVKTPDPGTSVAIYPNPCRSSFALVVPQSLQYAQVVVTNVLGYQVASMALSGMVTQVNLGAPPPGTYFVSVTYGGDKWVREIEVE